MAVLNMFHKSSAIETNTFPVKKWLKISLLSAHFNVKKFLLCVSFSVNGNFMPKSTLYRKFDWEPGVSL